MRYNFARLASLMLAFASADATAAPTVHFSREIRPILSQNCFFCHGPDESAREANLRLDMEDSAKGDHDGIFAIVPGQPNESALIQRIESIDPDEVMPPPRLHKTITPEQIAKLKLWIEQGAHWGGHWSYEPVVRPPVPLSLASGQESNPIDQFLSIRLAKEQLDFSPAAGQATLIRRYALDITGLPPTHSELSSLAQYNPQQIVAHFLNSPSYGEHWGRQWLDLARYADSAGYPSDPGREIWSYRDWVIRALNANMPFDQFTIEQLAGDLLPNPTDDQMIATAFHRNTMTNNEGGTNDEEFRTAAIIDRVNTTLAVWMGTTMACAQCHTHKYDPITQHEYFQFYAFLNQTADADKKDESPLHELIAPELKARREVLSAKVTELDTSLATITPERLMGFDDWLTGKPELKDAKLKDALAQDHDELTVQQVTALQDHYLRNASPATHSERAELADLRKQLGEIRSIQIPVMQDLHADKQRHTFVQLRGNWQALGDEVQAATPAAFNPLPTDAPRNRLSMACWLVSRDNPLTARVTVNRIWEAIFGVGIVRSSEEFGSQGDLPEHPELLDWLAAEFVDSGWDVKHLLTLIFTSRAYRQVSNCSEELNERDPDNRWLARGPRVRPTGELLRDQALAVSGLLSTKMYGPPVRPMMPQLGLKTAFGQGNDWETSPGEDRHRRSLYTEVRRNNPYPSFTTFDAPNREVCTIRRSRSNTPLQAFVTLNDPVFVEAHQALARRIVRESSTGFEERVQFLFNECLARSATATEIASLAMVQDRATVLYRDKIALATQMATAPLGPVPTDMNVVELAVWTTITSVVMNLDEFLMRL